MNLFFKTLSLFTGLPSNPDFASQQADTLAGGLTLSTSDPCVKQDPAPSDHHHGGGYSGHV